MACLPRHPRHFGSIFYARKIEITKFKYKELRKLVELDQIKYELTDRAENLKELGESL